MLFLMAELKDTSIPSEISFGPVSTIEFDKDKPASSVNPRKETRKRKRGKLHPKRKIDKGRARTKQLAGMTPEQRETEILERNREAARRCRINTKRTKLASWNVWSKSLGPSWTDMES